MEINYTIIIPHKNIPILLQRCLDSIPCREDVQIVVVDDNSDPNIVDFDKFPGLNIPNVEVCFTKEGKGAGYARNVGLKCAKGKWILFADSDDYFTDYLSICFMRYLNSNSDVIYFKVDSVYSDTLNPSNRAIGNNNIIDLFLKNQITALELGLKYCVPWGKIIRKRVIDEYGLLFSETQGSNDVFFSTRLALSTQNVMVDLNVLYCNTLRQNSLTTIPSLCILNDRLNERLRRNSLLLKSGYKRYMGSVAYILFCIYKSSGYRELIRSIKYVMKSDTPLFTGWSKWLNSVRFIRKYGLNKVNV